MVKSNKIGASIDRYHLQALRTKQKDYDRKRIQDLDISNMEVTTLGFPSSSSSLLSWSMEGIQLLG